QKLFDWIDERIDITPIWRDIADHEVPEHVNPAHHFSAFVYCFGGLTFFVVVIQILSGMFLTMYYVPDIENAWKSVYYLQTEVAHGQIVRGMHHWGASVVVVMLLLHTMRVFFQGAYKKPRELNWMVGVLIFFVMLGLGFTGYLLPWDNKAYFATQVGLEIAEQVPFIGGQLKTLLAGDADIVGAQTLTRFFAIHVFFLPAALFGLLAAHFILIRRQGIAGPLYNGGKAVKKGKVMKFVGDSRNSVESKPNMPKDYSEYRGRTDAFWPNSLLEEWLVGSVFLVGFLSLTLAHPSPLEGVADPTDAAYIPLPDWYFLFLYEL